MTFLPARKLTQEVMLGQIEQVLRRGPETDVPAYTLILGAGASYGSVPTARQMLGLPEKGVIHPQSIPLYLHELDTGAAPAENERAGVVADFWRRLLEANPDLLREATTDGQTQIPVKLKDGLPDAESIPNAYKHIFSQQRTGGLNTPSDARAYIRQLTLPKAQKTRLNGTHFYLASLLSLQEQRGESGEPRVYIGKRPFARTIFTTNFDPLLQVSLQLFQLLYYMTDRPEQLAADALHTDGHPAVHLFYAHGSVHRPFLANTDSEIGSLRAKNAQGLSGYLSQHGVIVLGYAGWDDCLLRALKQTSTFANNLYWLARGESSLTEDVKQFLASHPNAHWVEISDGGQWMAALHRRLCPSMPFTELLADPIPFVRRRIESVDLTNIETEPQESTAQPQDGSDLWASVRPTDTRPTPEEFRGQVIGLLSDFEKTFERHSAAIDARIQLKRIEHQADLAFGKRDWSRARELYVAVVSDREASREQRARALIRRADASWRLYELSEAIADCTRVIEMPDAPTAEVAHALVRRGVIYGEQGKREEALADYTRVIEMPDAPNQKVAQTLMARGVAYAIQGKLEAAAADFTRVIEMPGAPTEDLAQALVRRGDLHEKRGKPEAALADCARVIEMPGAPPKWAAKALLLRGELHEKQGEPEAEVADYTRVIEMPDAPTEDLAHALACRGDVYEKQGKPEEAMADYMRVIEMPGAPNTNVAHALVRRGATYGEQGKLEEALADFTRVIELPGVTTRQVAVALICRGATYRAQGRLLAWRADSDRVAELAKAGLDEQILALGEGMAARMQPIELGRTTGTTPSGHS